MRNQTGKGNFGSSFETNNPSSNKSVGRVSFEALGEATTVPIEIRRAVFDAAEPIPFLHRFIASLELTVINATVRKDIAGRFRINLPVGAMVKKIEVLRCESPSDPQWFPAVAVPKKKAKEVIYKEKEKGREVAVVSDVASGSNAFEIEVFPLPYGQEVKCRLECIIPGDFGDLGELAKYYFPNDETEVIVNHTAAETKLGKGDNPSGVVTDRAGAAVGDAFSKCLHLNT
mmetsp:Transcript_34574/g.103320  ORF Transcript_34574/g.103320 Transcript_34574/m.103320 type:complete len:230 (+) Transcript_34574:267-956(+)